MRQYISGTQYGAWHLVKLKKFFNQEDCMALSIQWYLLFQYLYCVYNSKHSWQKHTNDTKVKKVKLSFACLSFAAPPSPYTEHPLPLIPPSRAASVKFFNVCPEKEECCRKLHIYNVYAVPGFCIKNSQKGVLPGK